MTFPALEVVGGGMLRGMTREKKPNQDWHLPASGFAAMIQSRAGAKALAGARASGRVGPPGEAGKPQVLPVLLLLLLHCLPFLWLASLLLASAKKRRSPPIPAAR